MKIRPDFVVIVFADDFDQGGNKCQKGVEWKSSRRSNREIRNGRRIRK